MLDIQSGIGETVIMSIGSHATLACGRTLHGQRAGKGDEMLISRFSVPAGDLRVVRPMLHLTSGESGDLWLCLPCFHARPGES